MLRGFRWQLLALILAVVIFVVSLVVRSDTDDDEPTSPPPTATGGAVALTITETPVPTEVSEISPMPETINIAETVNTVPTYREGLIGQVQRINPILAGLNPVDADISSLIFEGLMRIDEYGQSQPALASDWVVSFDGLEYVFTLRQDVLWQDGVPFTASDVLYTMSLLASPDYTGLSEVGAFWRTVEVEQIGEYQIRFRLAQPYAGFLEALRIGILPAHALEGISASQIVSHPFNLTPIGTGRYQLEGFDYENGRINAVNLRVAPVYRQRPEGQAGYAVDRLTFKLYDSFEQVVNALEVGDIDGFATQNRSQRQTLLTMTQNFNPYTAVEPTVGMIIFNWVNENTTVFNDARFRQGLQYSLERSSLVDRLLANSAILANSPLPPNSWAYVSDLVFPAYNLELATQWLSRVNFPEQTVEEGVEATPVPYLYSFRILTPDDPTLVGMAQEIALQWGQIGLDVQVDAVNFDTYRTRLDAGDFDTALVELSMNGGADPDVYTFWHQGQYPDGQNYGGANDRTISELLERGRQDVNGINRAEFYQEFQREFIDRAIAIPLYYPLFTYVTRTTVQGVQLGFLGSPTDRFQTLQDWQITP